MRAEKVYEQYRRDLGVKNAGYSSMIGRGVGPYGMMPMFGATQLSGADQSAAWRRQGLLDASAARASEGRDTYYGALDMQAKGRQEYQAMQAKIEAVRSRYTKGAPGFPSLVPEMGEMDMEEMEKFLNEQGKLQQDYIDKVHEAKVRGKELDIMLNKDGFEERKALLVLQYEEEYGMIDENNELKKQGFENLQSELSIIEREAAIERVEEQREIMMRWADMWGSMLVNAANMHGNFAQNVLSQFKSMMTQMAIMSATYGVFNLLTGGAGGFMGGVGNYFTSRGLTSASKPVSTVYNDNSTMNMNFSAAERAVMSGETNQQLAARMRSIIRDGHLSFARA
jgi:hypothetical protein